jgi:hypothetical protein
MNNDFRRVVKFIKAWKNSHKEKKEEFKLKSFHIEQVIIQYYQENAESSRVCMNPAHINITFL